MFYKHVKVVIVIGEIYPMFSKIHCLVTSCDKASYTNFTIICFSHIYIIVCLFKVLCWRNVAEQTSCSAYYVFLSPIGDGR